MKVNDDDNPQSDLESALKDESNATNARDAIDFTLRKSSLMLFLRKRKKLIISEQIVSKIKFYVLQSNDNFYIKKVSFDHPESILQLKRSAMSFCKAIDYYATFLTYPDGAHIVYEQIGCGIKYYFSKSVNNNSDYYIEKIKLSRPISLNRLRSVTIGSLHASYRAVYYARDAAILVHKDGFKAMSSAAFMICGNKEQANVAVQMAQKYLCEHPEVAEQITLMYAKQASKQNILKKWFRL
ncbi:MAG: hypothetical protein LBK03_03960 [Bacteroidales bacterium]|jgi:hypothetical protein|nr:hypothetical protein [Bacteroidales bacterium]